ncbi:XylR family transcriptional regulator [Oceaniferula spumae]|uniref:XylR family transcriptional regulator n=1 Tax=Oceaniferula spumae TaxID=2979115 RepID=A0AAT9FGN2_9BACT
MGKHISPEKKHTTILVAFDWYDHRVYRGIAQYCKEHHWHLSPYCFSERIIPVNWPGDGAITCFGDIQGESILGLDMPKVDVTLRDMPQQIPRVVVDNDLIGKKAASHFLKRGFKEFAYFSWGDVEINQIRKEAFINSLSDEGVTEDHIHIIHQPDECLIRDWKAHTEALIEQVKDLPRPLAVFTGQDNLGVTLVEACVDAGISVPEEIAVLGVDNIVFLCECSVVPLSSIDTHLEDLGYAAAEQLGRLLSGEIDNSEPVRTVPPGDVINRRSTESIAISHIPVANALKLMRSKFKDNLTLEDVYEHVGLSKRGLEKAFKKHLNDSPASVLRQIRLNYAKKCLTQSDIKIEAIALECGYSNSSNLSHAFNREIGIPPLEYRNRYRSPLFSSRNSN